MGGCFSMIGKKSKRPLYVEEKLHTEDYEDAESIMDNDKDTLFSHTKGSRLYKKVKSYMCSAERCSNLVDFALLTKSDFREEKSLKKRVVRTNV